MMTQFPSSIDTIKNNIKKHILLQTSEYSTTSNLMDIISFNDVDYMTDKEQYKQKHLALGVLLEGEFDSNFKNRIPESYKQKLHFIEKCKHKNNMIIISDGNFITNQIGKSKESRVLELNTENNLFVTPELKKPLALGYERNSFKKYNNSYFILNCINYLLEEKQENYLFEIRKKETKINKLDKVLLEEAKNKWKKLNIIIPQLFVIFLFLITYFVRIQKYKS
jgi:gliding-associated putative ABC transporter substrate-binding component GldG